MSRHIYQKERYKEYKSRNPSEIWTVLAVLAFWIVTIAALFSIFG